MLLRTAALAALGTLVLAAPALAAPKANTITAVGGMKVKPNAYIQDNQHWDASVYRVKSGSTVTLRDKSTEGAPHTLSIVDSQPKTIAQIMGCKPCGQLMQAHQVNEQTGQVGQPLVESGADGFDTGGDSIVLPPKGKVTFKVTAVKGTTLNFLCAVHPWMLGQIKVT